MPPKMDDTVDQEVGSKPVSSKQPKRKLSEVQKADMPPVTQTEIPESDSQPVKKSKKESDEAPSAAEDGQEKEHDVPASQPITSFHAGDDLIPMSSTKKNYFYGWCESLIPLFDGEEGTAAFFQKHKVMHAWELLQEQEKRKLSAVAEDQAETEKAKERIDEAVKQPYVSITADVEYLDDESATLLKSHFEALNGSWFEFSLMQEEPEEEDNSMGMLVLLQSSQFQWDSDIYGGKELGQWWMSDLKVVEGEELKAVETVVRKMF